MADVHTGENAHHDVDVPTGEELASRLFTLVMAGVVGAMVMMAVAVSW